MGNASHFIALWLVLVVVFDAFGRNQSQQYFSVTVKAKDRIERTRLAQAGIALDSIVEDSVSFVGTQHDIDTVKQLGFPIEFSELPDRARNFPSQDALFHDYSETVSELNLLASTYPQIVQKFSLGISLEGRQIVGVRLSSHSTLDSQPTALLMGCHHAREHLSVEVPLLLAKYLAKNYESNPRIRTLLDTREVWIVPMVNPDGAEFDIQGNTYHYWRKNRRNNGNATFGVDLNRNYGGFWGGPGSSSDPVSETYRGPSEFSEPETKVMRDFVRARKLATVLLSFHTFSELILWPWGHTYDPIAEERDREVFEIMGRKMSEWNHYVPQKSSDLYLASGDTTDWAYEELKLFAFTFELSPSSIFDGGFYPGAAAIEPTFKANIEPALYLIEKAQNPYSVLGEFTDPLELL